MGWPVTDFQSMDWLHRYEGTRRAKQVPAQGHDLDEVPFSRATIKRGEFPVYEQLLTPTARSKIESLYREDFEHYRDHL